tara:strand:+ start:1028 stop:1807 length:780 start_codon:yes stop_codon:yes gene_type:complete
MSNTINWGKIHGLSYSPETNLTGTATTPSFSNTKSVRYDGIDDLVDCGTGLGNQLGVISSFTVSVWIKPSITTKSPSFRISSIFNLGSFSNSFGEIIIGIKQDKLEIRLKNNSRTYILPYTNTTNWEHIAFVYDGSNSSNTKLYINNVEQSPTTGGAFPSSLNDASGLKTIIGGGYSIQNLYEGGIDEVAYFNSSLSTSDISAIYGTGAPNDISSLSPLSWWRMGDGDTFPTLTDNGSGGNDGTMTNMTSGNIVTDVPT